MANTWKNDVKFVAGSSGTGSFSIGAAVDGFRTPAQAGYTNGQTVSYTARLGTAFESGLGTYSTSGPALARTTVRQSSNGDAAVDFASAPVVMLAPLAEDFDHIYQEIEGAAVDVASGTTTNIGAAASSKVRITGTTTITAFDTVAAGITREGYFSGILTLTHNGTSLILPGAANITTAANDRFKALSLGSGNWIVLDYVKATGTAVVQPTVPTAAAQSDQETATSTTTFVPPGRQQYHPSAAKAWVNFNGTGTVAIRGSYNITSITDNGTGDYTVNWADDFSSVNYAMSALISDLGAGTTVGVIEIAESAVPTAGAARFEVSRMGQAQDRTNADVPYVEVIAFGDQ